MGLESLQIKKIFFMKAFSANDAGITEYPFAKNKPRHRPYISHKKLTQITELNEKCKTITLLENHMVENTVTLGLVLTS